VSARLFCLDTVLVDVVVTVAALPPRAGDVRASGQLITTGGGFNAMSAAARHDLGVVYAGRLGVGPFSTMAQRSLENEGIIAPVAPHATLDTGICLVLVEPDGERTFITAAGAEATLRASDLEGLDVNDGDVVLVSGYNVMDEGMAEIVLEWLGGLSPGVIVFFDPATRASDVPAAYLQRMLARANWLTCNASEGVVLTGRHSPSEILRAFSTTHSTLNVILRTGARGCLVAEAGEKPTPVAGFRTSVVDTNGAGDVHNGVFIAEWLATGDALGAARWANAAAAMAIATLGPASCPPRADVAQWLAASSASK